MKWYSPYLFYCRMLSYPIHLLPSLLCSLPPPLLSPSPPPTLPTLTSLSPSLTRCAICMMDYCAGEPIRLLPCMHYYHLHCIDDWLMRSLTCPTCMERVDTGLMATLRNTTGGGTSRGGGRRFSLRRRRRGRGQGDQGSVSDSPNLTGASTPSSRSSSTSSSTELLSPGGQFSWPPQSCQHQQHMLPSTNSGTIFLPPFPLTPPPNPTPRPTSQNSNNSCPPSQNSFSDLGPLPTVISSPSSATAVVHPSPPHSPILPSVTIHMHPTPGTPHPGK